MKISAKTDVGMVRSSNQDAFATMEISDNIAWGIVCDGMGGANGGNIASTTAVNIISEKLKSGYYEGMNDNSIKNLITSAIDSANAKVFSISQSDPNLTGMGTTVVLAFIKGDNLYIAHVGDSRIYIISDENITQLTTDHSVVQMMIENGEITPEEAVNHPKKNVITRALGVDNEVRIDYSQEEINEGDIILLCSDGLTNFVDTKTIHEICKSEDKYVLTQKLVDLANENGGKDNITAVTITA